MNHGGQRSAAQATRQRTQRKDTRLVQFLGAELEHLDQPRLVQHRVGVGRAHQAGDTPCHGGGQLALEHTFVLMARLAQTHRQIDQPGGDQAAAGVHGFVGHKVSRHSTDADNAAGSNRKVGDLVKPTGGVDDTAVFDEDFHFFRRENKKLTQAQENEKVLLKQKANRYTYEGKMANFSFIKKIDRKVVDKKFAMSFADFKKSMIKK